MVYAGSVSREEVDAACRRLRQVQRLTDEATREAGDPLRYRRPSEFGTAVHVRLRRKVDALSDPDLKAELSLSKTLDEALLRPGSIRIDVVEDSGIGPICVYDIKTGRRGLTSKRVREFARRLSLRSRGRVIIISEIRPYE